jgi:hypothetical protein
MEEELTWESDLDDWAGFKNLLYNEVERIQDKINLVKKLNDARIKQYINTLKISLFFIAAAIFTIVKTIYIQS